MAEHPIHPWKIFVAADKSKMSDPKSKSERLLRRTLSRKEYFRYMARGYVLVRGSEGGLYKLTKSKTYNVHQLKPEKRTMCAVPADVSQLDHADIIVAQYLALTNDEEKFVETANTQGVSVGDTGEILRQALTDMGVGRGFEEMVATRNLYRENCRRREREQFFIHRLRSLSPTVTTEDIDYVLEHIREFNSFNKNEFIIDIEIDLREHPESYDSYSLSLTSNLGNKHFIKAQRTANETLMNMVRGWLNWL